MKIIKLCFVCLVSAMCLVGCGDKSQIKSDLANVQVKGSLPEPSVTNCRYLYEADEAVYEQQLAACAMYAEAYMLTDPAEYEVVYGESVKSERIASYCYERRKELNLEIATELYDNVSAIMRTVQDCENILAYLERVEYDVINFYDYYCDYNVSEDREQSVCTILKTFYERSNVLAFAFMAENKNEFIDMAMTRIIKNSQAEDNFNAYILENNELIKALNTVYGGVSSQYASIMTEVNTKLIRRMLEHDNELDESSINALMIQLGEPTPTPEPTATPKPTATPAPASTQAPVVIDRPVYITPAPMQTAKPSYEFVIE